MKQPKALKQFSRKYPSVVGILGVLGFFLAVGFIAFQAYYLQKPTQSRSNAASATGSLLRPCSPERALQCEKDGFKGKCFEDTSGSYLCTYRYDQTVCTEGSKRACGSDTCVVHAERYSCFGSVGSACPADRLKNCLDTGFGDCKRGRYGNSYCVYKNTQKECVAGAKFLCEQRGYTRCDVRNGDFVCSDPRGMPSCSDVDKAFCNTIQKPNCSIDNGGYLCSASENTTAGMSVQLNKPWINRGESMTISWQYPSSLNPEASDMFEILNNSNGAHVANLYPGSCSERPGAAPATSGSCTFSTANYGPGGYSIYFFKGDDHTNRVPDIQPIFTVTGSGGAGGSAQPASDTQAPVINPRTETSPTAVPTTTTNSGNPVYQYHYDPNN